MYLNAIKDIAKQFSKEESGNAFIFFPSITMKDSTQDELIREEIEIDMMRLRNARVLAEELVRARGWTEKDEDFWYQIEDEIKIARSRCGRCDFYA